MNKVQLKEVLKLLDSVLSLLETGYFPGRKSIKVLDSVRYINLMKQEVYEQIKLSKNSRSEVSEPVDPIPAEAASPEVPPSQE